MTGLEQQLTNIISPVVLGLGYEFVGLQYFQQGKYALLRIYIDQEGGLSLDGCSKVSHQISGVLDVENLVTTKYTLEVSSPGLDRLLFTIQHYQKFIGSKVNVKLKTMLEGQRKINGHINEVMGTKVIIKSNNAEWTLDINQIDRAQIVAKFN